MPVHDGAASGGDTGTAIGPQRVFLHVGPPKTGTTFVQSVLWSNKSRLRGEGVLVPGEGESSAAHFAAAADLRGRKRRKGRPGRPGDWDKLAAEARDWPGTAVISCEWLAFCPDEQVARAIASFGDAEVHVVVTLRDLGRVVPAVWQEQVKNGKDFTMAQFLDKLARPEEEAYGKLFWSVHDTRQLLERWGRGLPPERVHLVTLPRPGSPPDELWVRFASLFSADPGQYDTSGVRANPGLQPAEAELLRRVNAELGGRMRKAAHGPLVKQYLHEELTRHSGGGGKIQLPPSALATIASRGDDIVTALRAGGYHVVGDLEDLRVPSPTSSTSPPEESAEGDVARAAVTSMTALLLTMQADGAHRRKTWRKASANPHKDRSSGGLDHAAAGAGGFGGRVASTGDRAAALARRVSGRVRRAATRS